jgi:hypothetical protein
MSDDKIKTLVEGAFQPLRCKAEIWDYGAKLKFKVYDQNNQIVYEVPLAVLSDKGNLDAMLQGSRADIQGKGITLDAWRLP